MPAVTSGRGKNVIDVDVTYHGVFFTGNPIGRLHRNAYAILRDEGAEGVKFAQTALRGKQRKFGAGYPDVEMADEMRAVPMRMRRGVGRLVVSANYGSHPNVRRYNRWIEDASTNRPRGGFRGHHIYREAARLVQSHIDGRIGAIADKLIEGLT